MSINNMDSFILDCYRIREKFLQDFLSKGPSSLNILSFINREINPLLNNLNHINKDFNVDIGWIQLFELQSKDYRDWGKVSYLFPLGDETIWEEHLKQNPDNRGNTLNYKDLLPKLSLKDIVRERIYYDKDISTNYILNKRIKNAGFVFEILSTKSAYNEPFLNLGVPIKGSNNATKNRVIIHLGIWDCDEVKGFLTLRLRNVHSNKQTQEEIIKENSQFCKAQLRNGGIGKKLTENFYELEPDSELNKSIKIFSEVVIMPVLNLSKNSWERENSQKNIDKYFTHDFIKLLDSKHVELDQMQLLEPIITEFLEYANKGYANSEELAMKVFYELFANRFRCFFTHGNTGKDTTQIFEDLKKSQEALFWIEEYRDHFIHSIKVFLLGSIVLSKIIADHEVKEFYNNKQLNPERLQFAWACVSCFHDFAISIQKINPLIRKLISRFMFKDKTREKELEFEIPNLVSGNHLIDSQSISVLKLIKISESKESIPIQLSTYGDILNNKLIDDISFKYLKRNSDHGVASAIAFMTYVLFDFLYSKTSSLEDFLIARIDTMIKEDKNLYAFENNHPNDLFNLYLIISKAILKHNFITDKVNGDDKEERESNRKERESNKVDFMVNPLGFILILVDCLQDWGRPFSENSKPDRDYYCEVKDIKFDRSELDIYVDYGTQPDKEKIDKWWQNIREILSLSQSSPVARVSIRWNDNHSDIVTIVRQG